MPAKHWTAIIAVSGILGMSSLKAMAEIQVGDLKVDLELVADGLTAPLMATYSMRSIVISLGIRPRISVDSEQPAQVRVFQYLPPTTWHLVPYYLILMMVWVIVSAVVITCALA